MIGTEEGKREEAAQMREPVTRMMKSLPVSAARLDGSARETLLEAWRPDLESRIEKDRSDCGAANAPRCEHCGGGMRYMGRGWSLTETALGMVRLAMERYGCVNCGVSARPRAARCYAEADWLLNVLGGVNFGAKRVERMTWLVGDDLEV